MIDARQTTIRVADDVVAQWGDGRDVFVTVVFGDGIGLELDQDSATKLLYALAARLRLAVES